MVHVQSFKTGQIRQRRVIHDIIPGDVQRLQIGTVLKEGNIREFVVCERQLFQTGRPAQRGTLFAGQLAVRHGQLFQIGQVFQTVQTIRECRVFHRQLGQSRQLREL